MPALRPIDFADLFGTTTDLLPEPCLSEIAAHDWSYRVVEGTARDAIVLDLLGRIEGRKMSMVKDEDKSRWEKGWGENLDAFKTSGGSLDALTPKYIRPGQPVRLWGEFVQPHDPDFEKNWYGVYRAWYAHRYLSTFEHIFEFGSGSGFNVAYLAQQFPKARVTGLDWAMPSVEIVEALREKHGLNTAGRQFDFFHPDYSLEIPPASAIFTVGALEQTGPNWEPMLDFFLAKKPACCFHIEPIQEWYDRDHNLVDYTGWKAHEARNFWRGFPAKIIELEKKGRARILKTKRIYFGSLPLEGYSQLFWQPV
jgi:SAM-dependent methyltransferase